MTAPDLLSERRTTPATRSLAGDTEPAYATSSAAEGASAADADIDASAAGSATAGEPIEADGGDDADGGDAAVVQLRHAPALEPPYDESDPPATALGPPGAAPELPFEARRTKANAGSADDGSTLPMRRDGGDERPRLPDAKTYSERLVRAVVEVIGRRRPLQQLMPLVTNEVYAQVGHLQRWISREAREGRPMLVTLRSVRSSQPAANVAEVTTILAIGERSYAAVLRLEILDRRWLCTLLHLL
jgi:hypothetical protein